MRAVLLLPLICLMGACTPMEWRRGSEVATIESDAYRKCRDYSVVEGMRRAPFPGIFNSPIVVRDRSGRAYVQNPTWTNTDRRMCEHTTMMQCMVDLGYDLVPIQQAAPATPSAPVTPAASDASAAPAPAKVKPAPGRPAQWPGPRSVPATRCRTDSPDRGCRDHEAPG